MSAAGYPFRVAPHILEMEAYRAGKPEEELIREYGLPRVIKMASNENCFGPSPKAVVAMQAALERVHRYPDSGGYELRSKLSARMQVPMEQIVLGNGSTDLVEIIARTYLQPDTNSITAEGTFLMYRIATVAANARCIEVPLKHYGYDLNAILQSIDDRTRIIYVANPNNPTGTSFGRKALESFLQKVPSDVLVVLDEAYREYVEDRDYPDGVDYLQKYSNVILLRTFSKIYGLAGIRIGYAMACGEIIENLNRMRSPFNTNAIAQAGALAALDDTEHVRKSFESNRKERAFLAEGMAAHGISTVPSVANFLLWHPVENPETIYKALLNEGLIVRPMKAFHIPDAIRVTVGRHEENVALLEALDRILDSNA